MSKLNAEEGQSIYDIVVQEYGTLENLGDFLTENPQILINDELESGQEVLINKDNRGDEDIKAEYIKLNFVTNNKDNNFVVSAQDQKQFQNGDAFDFMDGDPFNFN